MKIYLSPERRPAPHGKYWGMDVYEKDVCRDIAERLKKLLEAKGFEVMVGPEDQTIYQRTPTAKAWGADLLLPIHTNACTDGTKEGTARGCEVGYCTDAGNAKALILIKHLSAICPVNRGARNFSAASYYELREWQDNCYPELSFHDNGEDAQFIVSHKQELAQALCDGICEIYGVTEAPTVTHTEQEYQELYATYDALRTRIKKALECAETGVPYTE